MIFKKNIEQLKQFLWRNKYMVILIIFFLLVRIKISEAPLWKTISNFSLGTIIFGVPERNTAWAEWLEFIDALGMSFLASLVFLFVSVTLPNMKKRKIIRNNIEKRVNIILEEIEGITIGCLAIYQSNPKAPVKAFEEYNDKDIEWITNHVKFDKRICLKGNEYITGFQFMYERAVRVKREVDYICSNYLEYITADEQNILNNLLESVYLEKAATRYIYCLQSGQIKIPEETMNELRKNSPKMMGVGEILIANGIVENSDIKNGVELYNTIKKIFVLQ